MKFYIFYLFILNVKGLQCEETERPRTTTSTTSTTITINEPCSSKYSKNLLNGTCMPVGNCLGGTLTEICRDSSLVCCIPDPDSSISIQLSTLVPFNDYLQIIGDTPRNRHLYSFFAKSLNDAGIQKCHQAAVFFAQIRGESNDLKFFEESSRFSASFDLDSSIGNNAVNDGIVYRGRGPLLLRGKGNYLNATIEASITRYNLLNDPEAAALPSVGFKIATWIWTKNSYVITENKPAKKGNLNDLADGTFHNFTLITHSLTQNIQYLKDRANRYEEIVRILKCSSIKRGRGIECEFGSKIGIAVPICLIDYKRSHCGCEGEFSQSSCPYGYAQNLCRSSSIIKCCSEKCKRNLDLLFMLDSSGSISFDFYKLAKKFIRDLVGELDIGEDATRVAIINYSKESEIILQLNSIFDKTNLLEKILNLEHQNGAGTNTQLALQQANEIIFQEKNGMRPISKGIPKVVVVITDGASNINASLTVPNAMEIKYRGISVVSVGIGDELNQTELELMATNLQDVYNVDDYDKIYEIIESLSKTICQQSAKVEIEQEVQAEVKEFSYNYFKFNLETIAEIFNVTNFIETPIQFNVGVTDIVGSTKLFFSFDEENPKDDEDYIIDVKTQKQEERFIQIKSKEKIYPICRPANTTTLYMSVKGLQGDNSFKLFIYNESVRINKCTFNSIQSIHQSNIFIVLLFYFISFNLIKQ